MLSHSFQDTELRLHRNVNDCPWPGRGGVDDSTVPTDGSRNKGVITQKNVNSTCIRTVFKLRSSNFTWTSMTLRDRSWRGWRFHRTLRWVRNKELITQETLIRRAFAQFSRYRVQTSQERQWLSGIGRGGVDASTVPSDRSEMKG